MNKRLVVLASGRGSNFVALTEACQQGQIPNCEVVALLTNNPNAGALAEAVRLHIPYEIISDVNREQYHRKLEQRLQHWAPDWICLAGYMRLLPASLIAAWENRIVNIHPSLLPAFPGLKAQRQALAAGAKITGCTVHVVTAEMDAGPILLQASCEIKSDDDEKSLSERLLALEHATYIQAIKRLVLTKIIVN